MSVYLVLHHVEPAQDQDDEHKHDDEACRQQGGVRGYGTIPLVIEPAVVHSQRVKVNIDVLHTVYLLLNVFI